MPEAYVNNPPLPRQYAKRLLVMEEGHGCRISDRGGREYLDMGAGIAVNSLGYGRSDLAEIAARQMRKLIHVSNLFTTGPAIELAEKIIAAGPPKGSNLKFEAVHFGNSGTEANETALKYARLYAGGKRGDGHHGLLAFSGGFHGRTMGALSLTANPQYRLPFNPLIPGAAILPLNDEEALRNTLDESFAAVIIEPIQGEGGLRKPNRAFAETLNCLCRQYDVLLIADEIQSGLVRCGELYASGLVGLEPDIITLAKPLAAGLPLSAVLLPSKVNQLLTPGLHATTFGGGPLTTAIASEVWNLLSNPTFIKEVCRKSLFLESLLKGGLESLGVPGEILGIGMLRGLRLENDKYDSSWCDEVVENALDAGLIILKSGLDALRLAPPLIISDDELAEGARILFEIIGKTI